MVVVGMVAADRAVGTVVVDTAVVGMPAGRAPHSVSVVLRSRAYPANGSVP